MFRTGKISGDEQFRQMVQSASFEGTLIKSFGLFMSLISLFTLLWFGLPSNMFNVHRECPRNRYRKLKGDYQDPKELK
jgi:hypothetical protein